MESDDGWDCGGNREGEADHLPLRREEFVKEQHALQRQCWFVTFLNLFVSEIR